MSDRDRARPPAPARPRPRPPDPEPDREARRWVRLAAAALRGLGLRPDEEPPTVFRP